MVTAAVPALVKGGRRGHQGTCDQFAAGAVTTWITGKVVKELKLPAVAAPVVGTVIGMMVNNAVSRLR